MRIRLLPAIVAGALLLPAVLSAQTTLLYEDFNGEWSTINPPPGWTIAFDGDTSTNDWHRRDSGSVPWIDNLTPYAALSDSPPEQGEDLLISPAIDCEDYNVVVLRCSTKVYTGIGPFTARLIGSVGGGPFDQVICSYQGVNLLQYQIFDISSWAGGESEVRLCWRFIGSNALISYWCVDNVSVIADSSDWRLGFDSLISWPPDTVDSGSVWPMAVLVRNFGARPFVGTFALELDIGAGYRDTVFVTDTLEPGQGVRVDFDPWTASVPGWHRILCRFALIGSTEDSIID
ncbi:MAG: hypothetical protein JSU73_08555, partial [candidate division WOR-3 bacterium]